VRYRGSTSSVHDAAAELRNNLARWQIYMTGEAVTEEGPPLVQAQAVRAVPDDID
jgi:hypothetical protein